jgi:hypothetical protein
MKRFVSILALLASVSNAEAQQRPLAPNLPCRQVQQIVLANGAAVIGTGQFTYDRYVSGAGFCQINESIEPAWIATRDTPQCPVGYLCRGRYNRVND